LDLAIRCRADTCLTIALAAAGSLAPHPHLERGPASKGARAVGKESPPRRTEAGKSLA